MSTQVQFRRGNTAQTSTFTGATAEITVDTDKETIVVHDGSTAGGFPLARESALTANQVFLKHRLTRLMVLLQLPMPLPLPIQHKIIP